MLETFVQCLRVCSVFLCVGWGCDGERAHTAARIWNSRTVHTPRSQARVSAHETHFPTTQGRVQSASCTSCTGGAAAWAVPRPVQVVIQTSRYYNLEQSSPPQAQFLCVLWVLWPNQGDPYEPLQCLLPAPALACLGVRQPSKGVPKVVLPSPFPALVLTNIHFFIG